MKFVRKNKYTIIAIIILIILVLVVGKMKDILVPDDNKASYGSRLEGIDEHNLGNDLFDKIKEKLTSDERVINVTQKVHGKIINFIITVNPEMNVADAKVIANSIIGLFENNELSFYTLQVFVQKEDASLNNFPIIGYKGPDRQDLLFTQDREIVTPTTEE